VSEVDLAGTPALCPSSDRDLGPEGCLRLDEVGQVGRTAELLSAWRSPRGQNARVTSLQPAGLIGVLRDKMARVDERDDAAIDLGKYDDTEAFAALVEAAMDPDEHWSVVASAGESIGQIWRRSGTLDSELLSQLRPEARQEIRGLLRLP